MLYDENMELYRLAIDDLLPTEEGTTVTKDFTSQTEIAKDYNDFVNEFIESRTY